MNKKSKIFLIIFALSILLILGVSIAAADSGGSISGGGQLRETHKDENGSQLYKISFGGWVQGSSNPVGEWEVNFHNVGGANLDKTKFHTMDIRVVNFFVGNSSTCKYAFNFTAYGKWNKKPGYKIIFRGGDFGSPGKKDTARVELFDPNGTKVYDTTWSWNKEFTNKSNCVGSARTGLDKGNLTVVLP